MAKGKTCNRNCFKCKYDDCIMEMMTSEERKEANRRDLNFSVVTEKYGSLIIGKAKKRSVSRCMYAIY